MVQKHVVHVQPAGEREYALAMMPKKIAKSDGYPECFNEKCDITKVKMEALRRWIPDRIIQLGKDDEVVHSYVQALLENTDLNPRKLQKDLFGFLGLNASVLALEIWEMMLEAQTLPDGVPTRLLQAEAEVAAGPVTEEDLMSRIKAFSSELNERVGSDQLVSLTELDSHASPGDKKHKKHKKDKKHKKHRHHRRDRRSGSRSRSPDRDRRRSDNSRSPPRRRADSRSPRRRSRSRDRYRR